MTRYVINELYRFRMLMAGVYVGIGISSTYGFSILTEHLKSKYGFSQSDITTISTVGNCVGYLTFFMGMLFDYAGSKVVLPITGFLGFFGFLLFGLAMDDKLGLENMSKTSQVICFSVFNAILYLGCPAMDVATLMPLMMNFPLERGYMVIIQKTFSGLGTSVLMAYFNGFFRNTSTKEASNYPAYVYFVGSQILFCALLGTIFLDLPPYAMSQYRAARASEAEKAERKATLQLFTTQHAPRKRLYLGCIFVGLNLIFLTVSAITTAYVSTSHGGFLAISIIAICMVALFSIMAMPFQFLGAYIPTVRAHPQFPILGVPADETLGIELTPSQPETAAKADDELFSPAEGEEREPTDASAAENAEAAAEDQPDAPKAKPTNAIGDPQYGGTFWRHLLTPDLWLLWFSFFGMWGTGTVMQMNASQIYISKNYGVADTARLSLYVAIMGVGSALGRIGSGFIDMQFQKAKNKEASRRIREGDLYVPSKYASLLLTTVFLPVGPILLVIAYLLFALVPADGVIVPFIIGSIGTGAGWGLGAVCVRIIYEKDIGKHYNFMYSSGFICTIALNRFMFGDMYDNQAKKHNTYPNCKRPSCVRDQMFILMAVDVLSTLTSLAVHIRYSRFVMRKRREADRAAAAAVVDGEGMDRVVSLVQKQEGDDKAMAVAAGLEDMSADTTALQSHMDPVMAAAAAAPAAPPPAQAEEPAVYTAEHEDADKSAAVAADREDSSRDA